MRLLDESFRNLDKKWIAIEKEKYIKKINKVLNLDLEEAVILAYIYIDHERGLCARLVGNIYHEDKSLYIEDKFITKDVVIYNDILKKIKFSLVNDSTIKKIINLDVIEKEIADKYYSNLPILEVRGLKIIDEFRHELYPDDLELYFEFNKNSELIWGRALVYSKEKNILACRLLNDSKINKEYKKGTYVFVKVIKKKKDIDIVIDTIANIKNKY